MTADLLLHRQKATERHDAALNRWWPDKGSQGFRREVSAVAEELETILEQGRRSGLPAIELSRTARWLADAYSDLARNQTVAAGEDLAYLSKAVATYQVAEELMAGIESARDQAVLDFNYANALRRFDIGNASLLESARGRYQGAVRYFSAHEPERLPEVRRALESVLLALQLAPLATELERIQRELQGMQEGSRDPARARELEERFRRVLANGGPPALVRRVAEVVRQLPESLRERDEGGRLQEMLADLLLRSSAEPRGSRAAFAAEVFSALQERLQRDLSEGKLEPARQAVVRGALDRLGEALLVVDDDTARIKTAMLGMRASAEALMPALRELSHGLPRPPPASRAARAGALLWPARRSVYQEMVQGGAGPRGREMAFRLARELTDADREIVQSGSDDARAVRVEMEMARPQVLEVRRYLSRRHPLLADPIWKGAAAKVDPSAVLHGGGDGPGRELEERSASLGLRLLHTPQEADFAAARWRQITGANACLFDLTGREGPALAAVAYEIGVAQAAGKPVVLLAREGARLPFDLDVPVVRTGERPNGGALMDAVENAVYAVPAPGAESAVRETAGEARRRFARDEDQAVARAAADLDGLTGDPIAFDEGLRALLALLGARAPALLATTWAGAYPRHGERRLFHVMPFRPSWAEGTVAAVAGACRQAGCTYVRGDLVVEPRIVHSIWNEICCASHVVADLTGFNANVAFELGIAHALGRPTLMVGQGGTEELLFPMLAKMRVAPYRAEKMDADLGGAVLKWLRRP